MTDLDVDPEERAAMDRGGGSDLAALMIWILVGMGCWYFITEVLL